jgi:monothiol glutaredoxin
MPAPHRGHFPEHEGTLALSRMALMPRPILDESRIHAPIRDKVAANRVEIVREVQAAIAANDVVVVGMRLNPFPRKARRTLDAAGIPYKYLGYGSYFRDWRRRTALKMWTGWQTFPMVFVKGTLIGGAGELAKLVASGELKKMLAANPRASGRS